MSEDKKKPAGGGGLEDGAIEGTTASHSILPKGAWCVKSPIWLKHLSYRLWERLRRRYLLRQAVNYQLTVHR